MADHHPTRRELLHGGLGTRAPGDDAPILASLLRVEQVLVFAYEHAVTGGLPSATALPVLTAFLDHERAHVRALSQTLIGLGAALPTPPKTTANFVAELRQLRVRKRPAGLHNERQHLNFLTDLEVVIARHYRFAIARLSSDRELVTAAEIMANEAQHATVLREVLSPGNVNRAVPTGFIAGVS